MLEGEVPSAARSAERLPVPHSLLAGRRPLRRPRIPLLVDRGHGHAVACHLVDGDSVGTWRPKLSVGLAPGPHTLDLAKLAVDLGCERVYLYDSAAVYEDVFVWLARLAEQTDAQLGAAVLVPNLRHVMTTASAIATLEDLAPGRFVYGFGTGESARTVLGKKRLSLATTRRYFEQLRGAACAVTSSRSTASSAQMIHWPGLAPARPIDVPLLWSAFGPKSPRGRAGDRRRRDDRVRRARRHGLERAHGQRHDPRSGRGPDDATRARRPSARGSCLPYHTAAQWKPDALDAMPLGREWSAAYEAAAPAGRAAPGDPRGPRHARERARRDAARRRGARSRTAARSGSTRGTTLRARAEYAASNGITELLYAPVGPNAADELRRLAELLAD